MTKEDSINKFLNGRYFFVVLVVFFIVSTWIATFSGKMPIQGSTNGMCFSSATVLNMTPTLAMALNLVAILGICALLILLNKIYLFIRNVTLVYVSSFLLLEASDPYVTIRFYDGTILCLVAVVMAFILFSTYQSHILQRRIFLTFAVLSFCCTFQYAFLYLIPVFLVGFFQMRAMSIKGILAMIIGLITPYWILLGTGLVSIDSLMGPRWVNVWTHLNFTQSGLLIGTAATISLLSLILLVLNTFHIFNYRTQIRAYNGFWGVLTICTILVMMIDYNNILVYLPILNCCLAIQIGHFFSINKNKKKYLFIIALIMASLAIYSWRIIY